MGYHTNSNSILSILAEKIESTSDSWISSTKSKHIKICIATVVTLLLCGSVVAGAVILKSLSAKWQYWLLFVVVEILVWVISVMLLCILAKTLVKLQKELDDTNYNYEEVQRKLTDLKNNVDKQVSQAKYNTDQNEHCLSSTDFLSIKDILGNDVKTFLNVNGELFDEKRLHCTLLSAHQLAPYYIDNTPGIIKHANLVYDVKENKISFQLDDGRILSIVSVMSYLCVKNLLIGFLTSGFPVLIKWINGSYQVVIDRIDYIYNDHYESAIESLKVLRGMLSIYRPWDYNQSKGQNLIATIILSFALRIRFYISVKPTDKGRFEPVSPFSNMIDDWLSAYQSSIPVDLNGIREIYQYLQGFDIDTLKEDSAFNILYYCWKKILEAYRAFSKEARKATEIFELEKRHDSDLATIAKLREEIDQLQVVNQTNQSTNATQVLSYNELQARYDALVLECERLKNTHTPSVEKQQSGDEIIKSHSECIISDAENCDNMQYYQPGYSMPDGARFLSETAESLFTAGKTMTLSFVTRRVSRAPLWVFSPNLILPNPLFANVLDSLATEITLKRAFTVVGLQSTGKPKRIIPATVEPKDDGFVLVTPGEIVY